MAEMVQPDVVGNYLAAYNSATDRRTAAADRQRNMQRQDVADQQQAQQFDLSSQIGQLNLHKAKVNALYELLASVPDGNEQAFEAAKVRALQHPELELKPEDVANLTIADLPGLKIKTGQAAQMLDLESKRAAIAASRASTQHSLAATQALQNKPVGNRDPNTGVRTPPAGVQGRDYGQLQKFSEQADAAASIAATLQGIKPMLDEGRTGPGFSASRTAAGVASVVPGFTWLERNTRGNVTQAVIENYDAIEQASKTIGIDTLQKMGGSDTERELLTAIQTTVNPDVLPKENARRFRSQIAAADILSQKAKLASEWVNKFGSLAYAAPDGTTWQGFWPQYQKQMWSKFIKSEGGQGGAADKTGATKPTSNSPEPPPGFTVIK